MSEQPNIASENDIANEQIGIRLTQRVTGKLLPYIRPDRIEFADEAISKYVAERVSQALDAAADYIEQIPCPGTPPAPLARYAFETGIDKAVRHLRDRAEQCLIRGAEVER